MYVVKAERAGETDSVDQQNVQKRNSVEVFRQAVQFWVVCGFFFF